MAVSEDIFYLVKSMNRAERTYFRRFAKMAAAGKNQTYLRLFSSIEKLSLKNKNYNENPLKRDLRGKPLKYLRAMNCFHIITFFLGKSVCLRDIPRMLKNLIIQ